MRDVILLMLRSGMRPIQVSREMGLPANLIYRIARTAADRYTGRHLTDEEIAAVNQLRELGGLTIRKTARQLGLSKTAVGRAARARFLKVQDHGGTEVKPEELKVPKRCPVHGRVTLWPCVACAATRPVSAVPVRQTAQRLHG